MPALGQHRAELVPPGQHLGAQAHHQQDRDVTRVAERLVRQGDAVALRGADPTHLLILATGDRALRHAGPRSLPCGEPCRGCSRPGYGRPELLTAVSFQGAQDDGRDDRHRTHPRRGPGTDPAARHRPGHRPPVHPAADRRGDRALRRAGAGLVPAAAARPGRRRPSRLRLAGRIRPAATLSGRSRGRGDLDQPAGAGVHRPQRPLRTHHRCAVRRGGPRSGRTDAQAVRPATRFVVTVRRCAAAGRQPTARRHPRHHPRTPEPEHPQVRGRRERAGGPGRAGHDHRARRPVPGGGGDRRPEHHRRRRHPGREDHPAEHPDQLDPGQGAGRSPARRCSSSDPICPTWSRCRPGNRISRATARSGSDAW